MPDTTDGGYPFPLATEPIAAGYQNIEDLAEAVDERNACLAGASRPYVEFTSQAIPGTSTWTPVDLNTSEYESDAGMVDLTANRIIVPFDGIYEVTGTLIWTGAGPTLVYATLQKLAGNVTSEGLRTQNYWTNGLGGMPAGLDTAGIQTSRRVYLDAGDSMELDIIANGACEVLSASLVVVRIF